MKDLKIVKLKNDDKYLILTSKVDISTLFRKIEKILNQRNVNKSSIIVDSYLTHGNNDERFYIVSYNYKTGRIEEKAVGFVGRRRISHRGIHGKTYDLQNWRSGRSVFDAPEPDSTERKHCATAGTQCALYGHW